jgi:hypothetical protein
MRARRYLCEGFSVSDLGVTDQATIVIIGSCRFRLGFVPITSQTIHHLLRPAGNGLIAPIHSFISREFQLCFGGEDRTFDNVLRRESSHLHAKLYKFMQLPPTYLSFFVF